MEYIFHYGDMHFVESITDMSLRKIRKLLDINEERIFQQENKMS